MPTPNESGSQNISDFPNPAELLVGKSLDGGWTVVELVERAPGASGGTFCVSYVVEQSNGDQAFLKALDYSDAFNRDDTPRRLEQLVSAFNFERDLLNECVQMSRVITALADGSVDVGVGQFSKVDYLIFEIADKGDVRRYLNENTKRNRAWKLRALHNTAVGLSQLHSAEIAHQDIKPSNVLVFSGQGTKIGDLGRSVRSGVQSPHESLAVAAQPIYSPPESLYGYVSVDWSRYRLGVDLYQLGSLAMFLFAGSGMTASMLMLMPGDARPGVWGGTYADVIPIVRIAHSEVFDAARQDLECVDPSGDLERLLRDLTDPDPDRRGDPIRRRHGSNPYGLTRIVSKFDRLCRRAEIALRQSGTTT